MINYEEMSDLEIAARVLHLKCVSHKIESGNCFIYESYEDETSVLTTFDPCNNPNDAWPIIVECFMDVELSHPLLGEVGTCTIYNPYGTDWQVDFNDNSDSLRAAMICFLKMKDNEKWLLSTK